jgi:hypothetical protein
MSKELENMDATVLMLQHLEKHIEVLYTFLISCGLSPKDRQLSTLTNELKQVKALKPKVKYIAYEVDKNGYVVKAVDMATFTGIKEMPKDINRGYYTVDNKGNLIVDNKRKSVLWGD